MVSNLPCQIKRRRNDTLISPGHWNDKISVVLFPVPSLRSLMREFGPVWNRIACIWSCFQKTQRYSARAIPTEEAWLRIRKEDLRWEQNRRASSWPKVIPRVFYLNRYVILPLDKSYGESSTVTRSPGRILIEYFRIFPQGWANIWCLFSNSTL